VLVGICSFLSIDTIDLVAQRKKHKSSSKVHNGAFASYRQTVLGSFRLNTRHFVRIQFDPKGGDVAAAASRRRPCRTGTSSNLNMNLNRNRFSLFCLLSSFVPVAVASRHAVARAAAAPRPALCRRASCRRPASPLVRLVASPRFFVAPTSVSIRFAYSR
jgi:hypothetical protein